MNIHERCISQVTQDTHSIKCTVIMWDGGLTFILKSFDDACTLDDAFDKKYTTQMIDAPNGKWHLHIFNTENPYQ